MIRPESVNGEPWRAHGLAGRRYAPPTRAIERTLAVREPTEPR